MVASRLEPKITTAIWRSAVGRRSISTTPSAGTPAISVGCVAAVVTRLIGVRALNSHHIFVHNTIRAIFAGEGFNSGGEFTLENSDPLLNNHVWFKISDTFNVNVEVVGLGVIVERLVCGSCRFPGGVVGDGPSRGLVILA